MGLLKRAMRAAIRKEVAAVEPFDELEREHIEDVLAWIDSGIEIFRQVKPATPPQHLVSYFACIDGDHILLVDHKDAELWLPSGGHVEPGEHPRQTVRREALEELGLEAEFFREAPLLVTRNDTRGRSAPHVDVSLWYVLRADRHRALVFDQGEFNSIRWFPMSEVPLGRSDPHMGRFLSKLRQQASTRAV